MGLFERNKERMDRKIEAERARNRDIWPHEDKRVEELASQVTPLNDRLETGQSIHPGVVLRYICALERRVARLENKSD